MKIYFGDNQFLGVNHSGGKGMSYLERYNNAADVAITLREAWDVGIRDFCFTVDRKTVEAVCLIVEDCPFNLHPAIPYAHGVNDLIAQKGIAGALFSKAATAGFPSLILAAVKALFGRYDHTFRILIATEIDGIPFDNVKSIGLLNIASDFLLGLNRMDLLRSFYRVVERDFKKKPCFYTMNFPLMADALWGGGYTNCALIFNYNSAGFRTNPNLGEVQSYIRKYESNESIAMSIFSGGDVDQVGKLLRDTPELSGVLFGTSKKANMISNMQRFDIG
jgi:hypothetical protein